MYLLPKEHTATKKILDSSSPIHCDIYAKNPTDTTKQQIDDFIRFVEIHLNKIKKIHCQRNTRVSVSRSWTEFEKTFTIKQNITKQNCNLIYLKINRFLNNFYLKFWNSFIYLQFFFYSIFLIFLKFQSYFAHDRTDYLIVFVFNLLRPFVSVEY